MEECEIVPSGKLFPTNHVSDLPEKTLTRDQYDSDQQRFTKLIETMAPILIDHTVTVSIIDDANVKYRGCTRWAKDSFHFEINLAWHDCSDWVGNYYLLIHELAHHKVQSNDHLIKDFYETVTRLGARFAQLALDRPELFVMANEGRRRSQPNLQDLDRHQSGWRSPTGKYVCNKIWNKGDAMSSHNDSYIASGNSPTHREILNDRDRSPAIPPVISASITVAVDPENSIDDQNVTVQKTLSFLHICLLVCLMNGRVKTVRHRKILALVVGETQCLRHIVTSDDCADFWIPRRPADRQSFKIWRRDRSRAHKILRPPVYHGECKPEGYKTVRLESVFPSGRYLIRLCNDLGYEHEAALAATLRAHAPQFRPVKDRRRGGSSEVNEATGGSRSSAFAGSYHPSSPSRRTLTCGGLPYFKVYRAVEKHRWDDETSRCVLEIVYARQSPKDLAAKTGLAVKTLNEYAYRIRREIEASGYKNCVSLAVTY